MLWLSLAFFGTVALGVLVVAVLDRWRKRPDPAPLSAIDELAHFRQLYERGEISQVEFERIESSLKRRIEAEMSGPGAGVAEPPSQPTNAEGEAPPSI